MESVLCSNMLWCPPHGKCPIITSMVWLSSVKNNIKKTHLNIGTRYFPLYENCVKIDIDIEKGVFTASTIVFFR